MIFSMYWKYSRLICGNEDSPVRLCRSEVIESLGLERLSLFSEFDWVFTADCTWGFGLGGDLGTIWELGSPESPLGSN